MSEKSVDPRMHPVTEMLNASASNALDANCDVNFLRMAVTELVKVVETLLPEPDPEPEPEPEPTHPSVARIKFANGGMVSPNSHYGRNLSDQALLQMRLAIIEQKNKHIETLEARIANQRKELDHLNAGRSLRNKELEARIEELELLTKAPASAIDQLRGELTGKLTDFLLKSA